MTSNGTMSDISIIAFDNQDYFNIQDISKLILHDNTHELCSTIPAEEMIQDYIRGGGSQLYASYEAIMDALTRLEGNDKIDLIIEILWREAPVDDDGEFYFDS